MNESNESRREFLRRATLATIALPFLANCGNNSLAQKSNADVLSLIKKNSLPDEGAGAWNGAKDAPPDVSWKTVLSKDSEPGERISIAGNVYQPDGVTVAPDVLIYFYHTDFEGFYGRRGDAHRHGRFRGWLLTDARGRYEFETIKPAPYPERRFAAHIHFTLTTAKMKEDWIDSILFEGDALITPQEKNEAGKRGGFNPILKLEKGADGVLRGRRDIQLMKI